MFVQRDLYQCKERAIVPAVWSASFRNVTLQISSAQLNLVILPLADSIQSPQLCFEKALLMSGGESRSHSSPLCTLACKPHPLFSMVLLTPLSFFPPGLYGQRGEMAPGELWSYSGNLCRCGGGGGISLLIELKGLS